MSTTMNDTQSLSDLFSSISRDSTLTTNITAHYKHSLKVLLRRGGLVNVTDRAVVSPVRAVQTVPAVVAVDPRQLSGERGEEVVQCPGDDDVIVETNVEGNEDHCEAYTC